MSVDVHYKPPTDPRKQKKIRPDLQDVINRLVLNAVDHESLNSVPEDEQLKFLTTTPPSNVAGYQVDYSDGVYVLNNGFSTEPGYGEKIRFVAPDNNPIGCKVNVNGVEYDIINTDGTSLREGEIQKDREVLIQYNGEKFVIIPTSSAPLLNMPIYNGPSTITVTTEEELQNAFNSINNKVVLQDLEILIDTDTLSVLVGTKLVGVNASNATVTIKAVKDALITGSGSRDVELKLFDVERCVGIRFENIGFEEAYRGISAEFSTVTTNNIYWGAMTGSGVYGFRSSFDMTDTFITVNNISELWLVNSQLYFENMYADNRAEVSLNSHSIVICGQDNSFIKLRKGFEVTDGYYGVFVGGSTRVYFIEDYDPYDVGAHRYEENMENVRIINTKYPIFVSFDSYMMVVNIYVENAYLAYNAYSGTLHIYNTYFKGGKYGVYCTNDSNVFLGFSAGESLTSYLAYASYKSLIKIITCDFKDMQNSVMVKAYNNSTVLSYKLTYEHTKDHTDIYVDMGSHISMYILEESTGVTRTSIVHKGSKYLYHNVEIMETNIEPETLTIDGLISEF